MEQASLRSLFEKLNSSEKGLSSQEASQRLEKFGPNDPTPHSRISIVRQILALFSSPLVIILLISALVSGILGDPINAAIIALDRVSERSH